MWFDCNHVLQFQYLIRWLNYPGEDSWVNAEQCKCHARIAEYKKRHREKIQDQIDLEMEKRCLVEMKLRLEADKVNQIQSNLEKMYDALELIGSPSTIVPRNLATINEKTLPSTTPLSLPRPILQTSPLPAPISPPRPIASTSPLPISSNSPPLVSPTPPLPIQPLPTTTSASTEVIQSTLLTKSPEPVIQFKISKTPDGKYSCSLCDKVYARSNGVKRHLKRDHCNNERPFGCPHCNLRFKIIDDCNRHKKRNRCITK